MACLLTLLISVWFVHATPPESVSVGLVYQRTVAFVYDKLFPLAHKLINDDPLILPNTTFDVYYKATGPRPYDVYKTSVDMVYGNGPFVELERNITFDGPFDKPLAVLGPVYSHNSHVTASICSAYQMPLVGFRSDSPDLSDKHKYPYYMRVWPAGKWSAQAAAHVVAYSGWQEVVGLYVDNEVGVDWMEYFTVSLKALVPNSTVDKVRYQTYHADDSKYQNDPGNLSEGFRRSMKEAVTEVNQARSRVVVWYTNIASRFMWQELYNQTVVPSKQIVTVGQLIYEGWIPDYSDKFKQSAVRGVLAVDMTAADPNTWEWARVFEEKFDRVMKPWEIPPFTATLLVASALHSLLYTKQANVSDIRGDVLHQELLATNVRDAWDTEGEGRFDEWGERSVDLVVVNLQAVDEVMQRVPLGTWRWKTNKLEMYEEVVYHTGKTVPPPDVVVNYVYHLMKTTASLRRALLSLFGISIVLGLLLLGFNSYMRKSSVIRMSSANFNSIMVVGGLILLASCYPMLLDSDRVTEKAMVTSCYFSRWQLAVGFTLFFGALLMKTCRVWLIFRSKDIGPVSVPDWKLILALAGLVMVDALVLLFWGVLSPFRYGHSEYRTEFVDGLTHRYFWDTCSSEHNAVFTTLLLGIKATMVLCGGFLAIQTRHVSIPILNDSRLIAFCIYNVMVLGCFIIPLVLFITSGSTTQATLDGRNGLLLGGVWLSVVSTMVMVFWPKIYHIIRGSEASLTTPKRTLTTLTRGRLSGVRGGAQLRQDTHSTNCSTEGGAQPHDIELHSTQTTATTRTRTRTHTCSHHQNHHHRPHCQHRRVCSHHTQEQPQQQPQQQQAKDAQDEHECPEVEDDLASDSGSGSGGSYEPSSSLTATPVDSDTELSRVSLSTQGSSSLKSRTIQSRLSRFTRGTRVHPMPVPTAVNAQKKKERDHRNVNDLEEQ